MSKRKYITRSLGRIAGLALVMLWSSCTGDEPSLDMRPTSTGSRGQIVVCGGKGDVVAQTRYVGPDDGTSGPQIDGTCYADQLEIYPFFISEGFTTGWPGDDRYLYGPAGASSITVPSPVPLEIMGRNGVAEAQADIVKSSSYIYVYTTALAYTRADRTNFTTAIGNRTSSTLTINGSGSCYTTPELYYGVLHLRNEDGSWNSNADDGDEMYWHSLLNNETSASLEGRIFRVVSQVNLTVTDIPVDEVSRIELFADNYPLQITLNGTHGRFYPVSAVTEQAYTTAADSVRLDGIDITATDSRATLSAFLLPSEVGMHLWVEVFYKSGETRRFDLRPQSSHYLTGADAAVYHVGDNLKSGSDLYVYNGNGGEYCFYSYANVRINMSGRYDNIAVDTGESNIEIEVNPNFEDLHEFEIK